MVDMDQFEQSQIDELRREIQIMSLCRHDNVLPIHRSFMHDSKLCIVTPVMTAGELTDIFPKHNFISTTTLILISVKRNCALIYQHLFFM
jgi:serine/threonine protein kinase